MTRAHDLARALRMPSRDFENDVRLIKAHDREVRRGALEEAANFVDKVADGCGDLWVSEGKGTDARDVLDQLPIAIRVLISAPPTEEIEIPAFLRRQKNEPDDTSVIRAIWDIAKERQLEISGMSWSGFNLVGDRKSIDEARRLQHRETYVQALEGRLAKAPDADVVRALVRFFRTADETGYSDEGTPHWVTQAMTDVGLREWDGHTSKLTDLGRRALALAGDGE